MVEKKLILKINAIREYIAVCVILLLSILIIIICASEINACNIEKKSNKYKQSAPPGVYTDLVFGIVGILFALKIIFDLIKKNKK
jgi:hypothetical protein